MFSGNMARSRTMFRGIRMETVADFARKFLDMCYRDFTWQRFTRSRFFVDGYIVVVLGDAEYTIKQNGRKIVYEDVVFLFHFNEAGKVQKFAHRNDTHQAWLAYHNK